MSDNQNNRPDNQKDRLGEAIQAYFKTERTRTVKPLSRTRLAQAKETAALRHREPAAFWKMSAWAAVAAMIALMMFPAFDTPVSTIAEGVNWVWDVDGAGESEPPDSIARTGMELSSLDEMIDSHDTSAVNLTTAASASDDDGDGDVDWIFQDDEG